MEVLRVYNNASITRRFLLWEAIAFSDLRSLPPLSPHFALFTAFDLTTVQTSEMHHTARILLEHGLAYACCWGEDCERWHDAIDHEDISLMEQRGPYNSLNTEVVMTTWHDKESLTEALWSFKHCTEPAGAYAEDCHDYLIVSSPDHTNLIRSTFRGR